MDANEELEARRSKVRIRVTYGAAAFLFGGGAVLVAWFMAKGSYAEAKDMFLTILPVSAAVVSYWFAGRQPKSVPSLKAVHRPGKDQDTGDDKKGTSQDEGS